jgi:serine/threonine-protein kinase RsbW
VQDEILMAVGEACTNAILHGSPPGSTGRVSICIHLSASSLVVDVTDEGEGFVPPAAPPPESEEPAEHGYGLFIIRRVMDRLEVFPGDHRTVVRMTKALHPWVEASARVREFETVGSKVR